MKLKAPRECSVRGCDELVWSNKLCGVHISKDLRQHHDFAGFGVLKCGMCRLPLLEHSVMSQCSPPR